MMINFDARLNEGAASRALLCGQAALRYGHATYFITLGFAVDILPGDDAASKRLAFILIFRRKHDSAIIAFIEFD